MSIKAYQRAATQAEHPRELEYRAFGQVTAGLVRAEGRRSRAGPDRAGRSDRRQPQALEFALGRLRGAGK